VYYREHAIAEPGGTCMIAVAQDEQGRYYGGFGLQWDKQLGMRDRAILLSPGEPRVKKFTECDLAWGQVKTDAADHLGRLLLDHLDAAVFDAVDELRRAVDGWEIAADWEKLSPERQDRPGPLCGECGWPEDVGRTPERISSAMPPFNEEPPVPSPLAADGLGNVSLPPKNAMRRRTFGGDLEPRLGETGPRGVSAETPADTSPLQGAAVLLPVEKIHRRPSNRGGEPVAFPEVAGLVESIEGFGLSVPIEVRCSSAEQSLPVGHYELVKGERRWTAFRAMGRDEIPAVIRELDEKQATAQLNIDNTHHVPLDPIQQAKAIQTAMGTGWSLADAAKQQGLSESAGKNRIRLLQLTPKLQAAIAAGALAERVARYLIPYSLLSGVMAAAEKEMLARDKPWYLWPDRSEVDLKRGIQQMVQRLTRPLDGKTKHDYGYQRGQHPCYFAGELDEGLRKSLGAVEVRIDNKPVLLATNVAEFDRRNFERLEQEQAAKKARAEKRANKARAEGKAANPDAERSQDAALERKIREWVQQFRRLAIAEALVPGDKRTKQVIGWLEDVAVSDVTQAEWTAAAAAYRGLVQSSYDPGAEPWYAWDLADDPDHQACLRARMILWPQWREWPHQSPPAIPWDEDGVAAGVLAQPEVLPERFATLGFIDEIKAVADSLCVSGWDTGLGSAWLRARDPGPYRMMLQRLLSFHNRRQLLRLAEEQRIERAIAKCKKVDEMRAAMMAMHEGQDSLAPPPWLREREPDTAPAAKRRKNRR
jgi:ParB family transcriptional regulator, chromosome partitioning protein